MLTLSLALYIAHGPYSLEPSERVHALTLSATLKETFPRAHPREACFVTLSAPRLSHSYDEMRAILKY